MKLKVTCSSVEETDKFAHKFGELLVGGEVIQLIGDLGAGKTTFVRGLVEGIGSDDHVSSPTFTICNTYHGRLTVHHCDFYRLHEDKLIEEELSDLVDGEAVVVMEWAENISRDGLDPIKITINTLDENSRQFVLEIPTKYNHLH